MTVLDEPCLVLNRNWNPVTFLPVQVAITTVMRDMASVLDPASYYLMDFEEWSRTEPEDALWIRTPSRRIPAPEVIVLKRYGERPPRKVSFNRPNLARRDEYACQYCGADLGIKHMTIDHVLPRSRGGGNSWDNCVAACGECNNRKADRTPQEAGMKLQKKPATPAWRVTLQVPRGKTRASWVPFLERVA